MPAPLVIAGAIGLARLGLMVAPRVAQVARAAGPAIARNAPKVIAKGKQLLKQGADTGSRLIKQYGPAVSEGVSSVVRGTTKGLTGLVRGVGRSFNRRKDGAGSSTGRASGAGKGSKGSVLKEAIKGAVKLEALKQFLSLFKSDKDTQEEDGSLDTTAPTRQPGGQLTTQNRNNVTRINAMSSAPNRANDNVPAVPGQGITTSESQARGGDEYVTYSALYKILEDFADATKSFIASTLQSLLPSIKAIRTSTLDLSKSIKSLVDLLETSAKQELARRKEETAEGRYKPQSDKDLLNEIRGKDPSEKKERGLTKGILSTLVLLAATTGTKKTTEDTSAPDASNNQAAAPTPVVTAANDQGVVPTAPSAPVGEQPVDGVTDPSYEARSNAAKPIPGATRIPFPIKTSVPSDTNSIMRPKNIATKNMVSSTITTAINLIKDTMEAKKTVGALPPIVLPAMGSSGSKPPLFSSVSESPSIITIGSFTPRQPLAETNFT